MKVIFLNACFCIKNKYTYLVNQSVMGKTNTFKGEIVKSRVDPMKLNCILKKESF